MVFKRAIFIILLLMISRNVVSAESYLSGTISNITAVGGALLIMLDSVLPTNCSGSPYNWMMIKKEETVMISVVLMMWSTGNKNVTIYASGREHNGTGYCIVNQVDPH